MAGVGSGFASAFGRRRGRVRVGRILLEPRQNFGDGDTSEKVIWADHYFPLSTWGAQRDAGVWRYPTCRSDTTDATSYNFTGIEIGPAPSGPHRRFVVAAIYGRRTAAIECTSCTIGGVSATRLLRQNTDSDSNGSNTDLTLWIAEVSAGETATITPGFDSTSLRCGMMSAIAFNIRPAPYSTSVHSATISLTGQINIPPGGAVFAAMANGGSGAAGGTWGGAIEFCDETVESTYFSAATLSRAAAETSHTINCTLPASNIDQSLVLASFAVTSTAPLWAGAMHHMLVR